MQIGGQEIVAGRSYSLPERWRGWRILSKLLDESDDSPELRSPGESEANMASGRVMLKANGDHRSNPGRGIEARAADFTPAGYEPSAPFAPDRAGDARIPSCHSFRVLFVVRPGVADAACMRYRGFNIIEAIGQAGVEAAYLDDRQIPDRLSFALGFDLIVLVRRQMSPEIALLMDMARRRSIPVLTDLDDYLFHEEVVPFVEMYRNMPIDEARRSIARWRDVILLGDGFTTTTPHLLDRAAGLGHPCYLIRNGLNAAQIELSRAALEEARRGPKRDGVRLGYFSGTRTHQDDFRLIADVLVQLLHEFPRLSLTVAGDFDLDEFRQFAPFADRVESRPFVDWRLLPSEIARVDVNLIPLQSSLFTEGKSNLKYYEAGLLKVPSIASPTQVFAASIENGANGMLANNPAEWYRALRSLISEPELRRRMGERAYEHVLKTYTPPVVASEAIAAYRDVIRRHRQARGIAEDTSTVVMMIADLAAAVRDRSSAVALGVGLKQAGAMVTLLLPESADGLTATRAFRMLAEHYPGPTPAVQVGGEIPCCDLLIATDAHTSHRARQFEHRARRAAYLLSDGESISPPSCDPRDARPEPWDPGLTLLVGDAAAAEMLGFVGTGRGLLLPPWINRVPAPLSVAHRPRVLLVAFAHGQPPQAREQAAESLRQLHAIDPDLRVVLCGPAAELELPGLAHERIPGLSGEAFERVLAERPICLALSTWLRPPWIYDVMAAGCPVVFAPWFLDRRCQDTETTEGFITVPLDAGAISGAVGSLIHDTVRLGALAVRSAAHVREVSGADAAARLVLGLLDASSRPADGPGEDRPRPLALSTLSLAS
ncbi:MAG: glycosyltransferase family 4 protein [Isosphaeraceae bacterium]